MKKVILGVFFTVFLWGSSFSSAFANGEIFGDFSVLDIYGNSIVAAGFYVSVLNAENAEPFGKNHSFVTDANGQINIGSVPAGIYKIYVSGNIERTTCAGSFVGPDNLATFESGTSFKVIDGQTTQLTHELLGYNCPELKELIPTDIDAFLGIRVYDSNNNNLLSGIKVILHDPETGFIRSEGQTDAYGNCLFGSYKGTYFRYFPSKVRLVDPSGAYQSEYLGAGGHDSFSKGTVVSFEITDYYSKDDYFKEGMVLLSTPGKILQVIENINNLGLDPNVEESLAGSLNRSIEIIEDENPNNDKAACGAIKGFINQLYGRVNSGKISESDAYDLEILATGIFKELECK